MGTWSVLLIVMLVLAVVSSFVYVARKNKAAVEKEARRLRKQLKKSKKARKPLRMSTPRTLAAIVETAGLHHKPPDQEAADIEAGINENFDAQKRYQDE